MRIFGRGLVTVTLLALPVAAHAAGLYVPDSGTTARARGGAVAAAANDPSAIYFNPAGLATLGGRTSAVTGTNGAVAAPAANQFLFDITVMQLSEKFSRDPSTIPADGSAAGTSATNAPPPQIVPDIVFVHRFDMGSNSLGVGGGIFAPAGARYKFKQHGPQRYTADELYLVEANFGVAVAFNYGNLASFGITLENMLNSVDQKFVILQGNTNPGNPTEDPSLDAQGHLKVEDPSTPTAIVGVKVTPVDFLDIGLSYRPAVHLDMSGTLETSVAATEKVHFKSDLPSIIRLGVRYVQPVYDVEFDFVREDWSVHKADTLVANDNSLGGSGQKTQSIPRNWKAAYSARLGSTFRIMEKLHGMAGVYYETSAVPESTIDVGSFDGPKIGINFGGAYDVSKSLTLALNLSHTLDTTVTTKDPIQRQSSGLAQQPADLSIINAGKYTGSYDFVGISALAKF